MVQSTPRVHPMPRVSVEAALVGQVLHRRVQAVPQWAWLQEPGNMILKLLREIVTQTLQTQTSSDRLPVSSFE